MANTSPCGGIALFLITQKKEKKETEKQVADFGS
jgi:hypothetical protein